jgi:asparagine synthase (glutamine-hydrolysing)
MQDVLRQIHHRGPDSQGHYSGDGISMGATRLRIMDLGAGDQPLFSPDGDLVVVFNGEIFNHRQLRRELEQMGHSFQTRCDTEVVLNAYRCWGDACFSRFRGMFAIGIWERSKRRLILARDHAGIKPLYYCLQDGEIYFGSEMKCILAHPEVRRCLDLTGLNCFLSLNYVPAPLTLVKGIRKLMPGEVLEWKGHKARLRSYAETPEVPSRPLSLQDASSELDRLLKRSVAEQMEADRPVGLWVSGGLDSSTILHYAASASSHPLRTYSVTFQGRSFDEAAYAREISEHYGTKHSEFDLNEGVPLLDAIERIAHYSDEPMGDAGAVPLWFLAEMTRKDSTVVLTGEGADELFAGYLTYKADRYNRWARKIPPSLRRMALYMAKMLPVSNEKISFEYKLQRFLQGSFLGPQTAHTFWNGSFSEAEKQQTFFYADPDPLNNMVREIWPTDALQPYLDFDQKYYMPDDILYKVDRMSMAHSIEARPPFLDPEIVHFARSLPENMKLRGATSKYILRELMRDKLPRSIMSRPKIGFDIPVHHWLRGPLRPLLQDTLSQDAIESGNLFHWQAVEKLLNEHLQRKANHGYQLWGMMMLLMWMKHWNIEVGPSSSSALSLAGPVPALGGLL